MEASLPNGFDGNRKINWQSLLEFLLPYNVSRSQAMPFKSHSLNVGLSASVRLLPT
jgi:hypothetical protein